MSSLFFLSFLLESRSENLKKPIIHKFLFFFCNKKSFEDFSLRSFEIYFCILVCSLNSFVLFVLFVGLLYDEMSLFWCIRKQIYSFDFSLSWNANKCAKRRRWKRRSKHNKWWINFASMGLLVMDGIWEVRR